LSVCPSVRMEQLGSHWTDFHEIWYLSIFRKSSEKLQLRWNMTRITGTLNEDQYTFMIISRSILLKMRNVSDKSCRENQNTHLRSITFFENRAIYEIMWKNIAEPDRPQKTIWCMSIAWWITKGTNTHSEYVILIAFLRQAWLHERASMLRYTYIAYLVYFSNSS
jgi:hypothetical protein